MIKLVAKLLLVPKMQVIQKIGVDYSLVDPLTLKEFKLLSFMLGYVVSQCLVQCYIQGLSVRFLEIYRCTENDKFKIFLEFKGFCQTDLELFQGLIYKLLEDQILFSALNICFKGLVVANCKSSNCPASNSNLHESSMKNILNHFKKKRLLYFKMLALFFSV